MTFRTSEYASAVLSSLPDAFDILWEAQLFLNADGFPAYNRQSANKNMFSTWTVKVVINGYATSTANNFPFALIQGDDGPYELSTLDKNCHVLDQLDRLNLDAQPVKFHHSMLLQNQLPDHLQGEVCSVDGETIGGYIRWQTTSIYDTKCTFSSSSRAMLAKGFCNQCTSTCSYVKGHHHYPPHELSEHKEEIDESRKRLRALQAWRYANGTAPPPASSSSKESAPRRDVLHEKFISFYAGIVYDVYEVKILQQLKLDQQLDKFIRKLPTLRGDLAKLDGGQQTKVVAEQRRKGRLAIGKDLLDEHCADISSDRKTGGLAGGAALQGLQNQCRKFAIGLLKEDITDEASKIDSTLVDDISWDGTLLDLWDEYADLLDKKNNAVDGYQPVARGKTKMVKTVKGREDLWKPVLKIMNGETKIIDDDDGGAGAREALRTILFEDDVFSVASDESSIASLESSLDAILATTFTDSTGGKNTAHVGIRASPGGLRESVKDAASYLMAVSIGATEHRPDNYDKNTHPTFALVDDASAPSGSNPPESCPEPARAAFVAITAAVGKMNALAMAVDAAATPADKEGALNDFNEGVRTGIKKLKKDYPGSGPKHKALHDDLDGDSCLKGQKRPTLFPSSGKLHFGILHGILRVGLQTGQVILDQAYFADQLAATLQADAHTGSPVGVDCSTHMSCAVKRLESLSPPIFTNAAVVGSPRKKPKQLDSRRILDSLLTSELGDIFGDPILRNIINLLLVQTKFVLELYSQWYYPPDLYGVDEDTLIDLSDRACNTIMFLNDILTAPTHTKRGVTGWPITTSLHNVLEHLRDDFAIAGARNGHKTESSFEDTHKISKLQVHVNLRDSDRQLMGIAMYSTRVITTTGSSRTTIMARGKKNYKRVGNYKYRGDRVKEMEAAKMALAIVEACSAQAHGVSWSMECPDMTFVAYRNLWDWSTFMNKAFFKETKITAVGGAAESAWISPKNRHRLSIESDRIAREKDDEEEEAVADAMEDAVEKGLNRAKGGGGDDDDDDDNDGQFGAALDDSDVRTAGAQADDDESDDLELELDDEEQELDDVDMDDEDGDGG